MADFPAVIELSDLDGTDGFQIIGLAPQDRSGFSVASAGDVNGDGFDDLIVGAFGADPNGAYSGVSYVVFGKASGFAATLDPSSLNGTNGFRISGVAAVDRSGRTVASAGDVNNDGFDDLIIGAYSADPNGVNSGASYVVFGKASGFSGNFELSTLDGTNGFRIDGEAAYDHAGFSVASAGDVNNDGLDDLIVGAPGADPNGEAVGASYVVFGKASGFTASIDLSILDGTNGFRVIGAATDATIGQSVASGGDVNGDGFGDLIIGAYRASTNGNSSGSSYVVFGKASGFDADLDLSSLDGTNGFRLDGETNYDRSGRSVASAGDVNSDGFDDLIIGAHGVDVGANDAGASYVVFGKAAGFTANLNLSSLDGTNGFRISGAAGGDRSGISVASAGDVNGDGHDDLIIGADRADPNGHYSGASYVVFGKAFGFSANLQLSSLDGINGFRIDGAAVYDQSGRSVAAAGDVNGDGYDDLIVGAYGADPSGIYSGAGYVIFGRPSAQIVNFVGTSGDDVGNGSIGADSLSGLGGKDTLNGLAGDDVLNGGDNNDVLNGGDGADDLVGGLGGDILGGDAGDDQLYGDDGADKLNGGAGEDQLVGGVSNDRISGGDDSDNLTGGDGNDYLDGGAGIDIMAGGAGNDVYIVDDGGDIAIEVAGEGYDIVRTELDGWALATNIEGLELQGSLNIEGVGNAGANNLQGNAGDNLLSGLAGVDTINGNDGNDIIVGGLGNDLLRGGLGADGFVVNHVATGTLETDQIYDFSDAEGDYLDLSGAFAGTLTQVAAFSKVAGQMTVSLVSGNTVVKLDLNGDGKADYQVKINGDVTDHDTVWLL